MVASLALAQPSHANTRYVSLDQQLTVEFYGECSTTTPSGSYRLQNGVSGTITANSCSNLGGDQFVGRFADTTGTYRCYGTMSQEWGQVVLTSWEIEGAVSGYSCLDVGERYTIEMDSGQALDAQVVAQDSASTVTPSLRPGAYYRGAYVSIYEHDGQFCYSGFSRNGSLIASISEAPDQPNVYFFDDPEARRIPIFQVDADTLSYGDNSRYERINDALPFDQLDTDSDMYTCLTSAKPFYKSEEHTGRQRPPQNR